MPAMIEIEWKGETLTIREDQAFEAAEAVEEFFTIADLGRFSGKPKLAKLSRGFAELVNFAGGKATPQEVRQSALAAVKDGQSQTEVVLSIMSALYAILMDGAPDAEDAPAGAPEKTTRPSLKAAS